MAIQSLDRFRSQLFNLERLFEGLLPRSSGSNASSALNADTFSTAGTRGSRVRNDGDAFEGGSALAAANDAGTSDLMHSLGAVVDDVLRLVSDLFDQLFNQGASREPSTDSGSGTDPVATPSPSNPASPAGAAPADPGSTAGAPIGDLPTRRWGGTAGQFDRVYQYPGDDSKTPSFGGWAWGKPPVADIEKAGFQWFETGYPDSLKPSDYKDLTDHGVRPFAYINMGEVTPDLKGQVGNVPILRHNNDWNTDVVDVRDPTWQQWLIKRADFAYDQGARGIKWDCAAVENNYSDPAQKQQAIDAMAKVMEQIKAKHPDMKFIVNQGYGLANKVPQLVDGVETESLESAKDQGGGMAQWANEEIQKVKDIHDKYGIPIFMADYTDPNSATAQRWASDIERMGFVPYITSVQWNVPGRGLNINPGW